MFPYEVASWSVVDGAMYAGAGTALPGICTAVAAAICLLVLIMGQGSESKRARRFD